MGSNHEKNWSLKISRHTSFKVTVSWDFSPQTRSGSRWFCCNSWRYLNFSAVLSSRVYGKKIIIKVFWPQEIPNNNDNPNNVIEKGNRWHGLLYILYSNFIFSTNTNKKCQFYNFTISWRFTFNLQNNSNNSINVLCIWSKL